MRRHASHRTANGAQGSATAPSRVGSEAADHGPIARIGELVDVLDRLQRGQVLEHLGGHSDIWQLHGARVHWSHETLLAHALIEPLASRVPGSSRSYRLSLRGQLFARRALQQWRHAPLWRRLMARWVH